MDSIPPLSHTNFMDDLRHNRSRLLRECAKLPEESTILKESQSARVDQLREEFNQIMDQIEATDHPHLQDPLISLPIELWQSIIYFVLAGVGSLKWEVNQLLLLTLVSKQWRQAVIYTPGFWNQIRLYDIVDDLEAKFVMCLQFSVMYPLDIYLKAPMPSWAWKAISPHLKGHGARIRSLTLFNYERSLSNERIDTFLTRFIDLSGKFSALEELTLYTAAQSERNLDFVLRDSQKLRIVNGVNISSETAQLGSVKGVETLVLDDAHFKALPLLRNFPHLKDVTFRCPDIMLEDAEARITRVEEEQDALKAAHEPWKWTSLRMEHYPGNSGCILWDVLSSTLLTLSVTIPWDLLPKLIHACSDMTQLNHLGITLPLSLDVRLSPFSVTCESTVKNLTLMIGLPHYRHDRLQEVEAADAACQQPAKHLADVLSIWATQVTTLDVNTPGTLNFIVPYIRSLRSLDYLATSSREKITGTFTNTEMPYLETIRLVGTNSTLNSLTFPNILDLTISEYIEVTDSGLNHISDPLDLSAEKWSNLRVLEVGIDDACWNNISLPNVKKITAGSSLSGIDGRHFSPSLLKELASSKACFPSLKHLKLRRFPDWDVLLIMLERRNFSASDEIAPITTLALPSLPAPKVLQPLVDRLRGRLTSRPCNYDMSTLSFADVYFSDLLGCDYCHKSFVACTKAPGVYRKWGDLGMVPLKFEVPSYPDNTEEVLATCLQRSDWWIRTLRRLGGRCYPCLRHEAFGLVEITGYTQTSLPEVSEPAQKHLSPA